MNELMELPFEKGIVLRLGRKPIYSDFYSAFRYFTYRDDKGNFNVGIKETDVEGLIPRGKHADIDLNERVYYCNPNSFEKGDFIAGKYVFESVRAIKEGKFRQKQQEENEMQNIDNQILNSFKSLPTETKLMLEAIKEQLKDLGVNDTYLSHFDYWIEDWTIEQLEQLQSDLNNQSKTLSDWEAYCLRLDPNYED